MAFFGCRCGASLILVKSVLLDITDAAGKDLPQYRRDLAAVFNLVGAGRIKPEISVVTLLKEDPKTQ